MSKQELDDPVISTRGRIEKAATNSLSFERNYSFCSSCGCEVKDGSVRDDTGSETCPRCGSSFGIGAKHCRNCGSSLSRVDSNENSW